MAKYLDLTGLGRLIEKIKALIGSKANDADVVKLTGDQDVEGTKTFNHIGVKGTAELPAGNKANGTYFLRFNLDAMGSNREVDLFRAHYAGRKFALSARRDASGDPRYKIYGDLDFANTLKLTGNNSVLKFLSENGTSKAQFIEFLKGNDRLGLIGLASANNDDLTIESSGTRSLLMNAFNISIVPRNQMHINGRLKINNYLLCGTGGNKMYVAPEDDSRKTFIFNRTHESRNAVFDLDMDNKSKIMNVPAPQNNGDAANKAYVDAKLSGAGTFAKILTNAPTTADLPAGFIGLKIIT